MNLFGKKKKAAPAPNLGDSIAKLREASENLDKRDAHLQKQIDQCLAEAKKKAKAKDKRGALFQLKKKKMYEKQVEQLQGKKINIETQILALEEAANNKEVLSAMKTGASQLKSVTAELDVDKVDNVMEDITESMAMAEELSQAMSQTIGPAMDEDELTAELEEMESELMDEQLLETPQLPERKEQSVVQAKKEPVAAVTTSSSSSSSNGPAAKPKAKKEDDELAQLEAMMGM